MFDVYKLCDTYREDDSYYQFVDVIDEVEQLIHKHNPDHILLGGDFNTYLSRVCPQTSYLEQHVQSFNMSVCIDLDCADVPCTYNSYINGITSRIDPFMVTDGLSNSVLHVKW